MKRSLLCGALAVGLLCLLAAPTLAGAKTIVVSPSPGGNDTAHLQAAFAAAGPGGAVQLTAGTYHTGAIFVRNFNGTFRGAGQGRTIIDTAGAPLAPNTVDDHGTIIVTWPSLFCFKGGNVTVSDMTVSISSSAPAVQWSCWGAETTALGAIFEATGTSSVAFDDLTFDTPAGSGDDGGYNVDTDIIVSGPLTLNDVDPTSWGTTGGSVAFRGCTFLGNIGVFIGGLTHGRLTLGGSPATGNFFDDGFIGCECGEESASQDLISYNRITAGVWDILLEEGGWNLDAQGAALPAPPAPCYLVADNQLMCPTIGVALQDFCPSLGGYSCLAASVSGNRFTLGSSDNPAWSGLDGFGTQNISCLSNSFAGYADNGIATGLDQSPDGSYYYPASGWRIAGNDFRRLNADTAGVWLGPGSSRCLVVGGPPPTQVLDQGTNDTLINVTPVNDPPVATAREMTVTSKLAALGSEKRL